MLILFFLLILLMGITLTDWGVRSIRNRKRVFEQFSFHSQRMAVRSFWLFWTLYCFSSGVSMFVAAVLLWAHPFIALLLAGWPVGIFGFLGAKKMLSARVKFSIGR